MSDLNTEISVSREIAAPAAKVWAMVSDVTRVGEWSPETVSAEWLKGATGPVVGARFTGTNRNEKKSWKTTCTVTESEPGKRFAFAVTVGLIRVARWSYRIDGEGESCTVTETWTDQRAWLARKLGGPISGVSDRAEHNRAGMVATLDRLAVVAERDVAS